MKYDCQPEMYTPVEPSWLQRLLSVLGMDIIVETTRNTIHGTLLEVEHDHVVLQVGHETFFVRCQQIISVMPIHRC